MGEPLSEDEGELVDRILSSSPDEVGDTSEQSVQKAKRPPTPERSSSDVGEGSNYSPRPKTPEALPDANNIGVDNDELDYSDGEQVDEAEKKAGIGDGETKEAESDPKKDLSDGELEEGELEDSDDDPVQDEKKEDGRRPVTSRSRTPSRSPCGSQAQQPSRSDGICKFYVRGNCTWGDTCKFFHPSESECERLRKEELGFENRRNVARVYQRAASPQRKEEDAWERGLKQARERMKKATELKKDPDFDKKRMLMSTSDISPRRRSDSEDSLDGRRRSRSPMYRDRINRRLVNQSMPFFPVGSNGRPPSLIDVMRNEDRRRTEAKDLGPQVIYPSRDKGRRENRRSNGGRISPIPLRDVAAFNGRGDGNRRNNGPSLRERCRQREGEPKTDRKVNRSPSSGSSDNDSHKRRKKRRQRSPSPFSASSCGSSRSRSRTRSSARCSRSSMSVTSNRSSTDSRSRSGSSSRSSDASSQRSRTRKSRRSVDSERRSSSKRRNSSSLRSPIRHDREPSSAADLTSFRIPKRKRPNQIRSRSRSPLYKNTVSRVRNERRHSSSPEKNRIPKRERSAADDSAPAAYRSNVDPLFGMEGIPLSPEGDPISSEDEPDPKREEVIRERDNAAVSGSSESSSGESSGSSSSDEDDNAEKSKSREISAENSRKNSRKESSPSQETESDEKERRRRQELLDQLKSVEEAIARKRNKVTA